MGFFSFITDIGKTFFDGATGQFWKLPGDVARLEADLGGGRPDFDGWREAHERHEWRERHERHERIERARERIEDDYEDHNYRDLPRAYAQLERAEDS